MGSFNHKGNLSNLPIEAGDKIVVLVGIRRNVTDDFSLGFSFTPVSLPIHGEYDDYGGIECVVKSPATDYLEKFFGMSAKEVVGVCERGESGCKDQVEDSYNVIKNKIMIMLPKIHYYSPDEYSLGYFMEHESVFNQMVQMGNKTRAEIEHWCDKGWDERFLEELGYTKKFISQGLNSSTLGDNYNWNHPEYPALLQNNGDFYLMSEPKDYDHSVYPMCYNDLCKLIGCDVPEKYKQSWYEWKFEQDIKVEHPIDFLKSLEVRNNYFINDFNCYGFFYGSEYFNGECFAMIFDTKNGGHLKEEFKKEFVEFASFIKSMRIMNMTWGVSNYYSQDCNYDYHKKFINACAEVIDKKIEECESED